LKGAVEKREMEKEGSQWTLQQKKKIKGKKEGGEK